VSTLGQRLRQARERAGLGVNELTRKAGVSQGVVTRIEQHQSKHTEAVTLQKLAQALGVTHEWLVDGGGGAREPRGAAREPRGAAQDPRVELDDRYPNRLKAAEFARGQLPDAVIEQVLAEQLQADVDPDPIWWLDRMRLLAGQEKFRKKHPGEAERQDTEAARYAQRIREEMDAARRPPARARADARRGKPRGR
jgi:transcriptional regulator with XRE-family HTH domain